MSVKWSDKNPVKGETWDAEKKWDEETEIWVCDKASKSRGWNHGEEKTLMKFT